MRRLMVILISAFSGLMMLVVNDARAATLPSVNAPAVSAFSSSDDNQVITDNDSPQALRAAKHHLYIPKHTPTPTEDFRWPTTNIKIYMDTHDRALQVAFRGAVRAWNRGGTVHIKWTTDEDKADIIARDGSLSNGNSAPGVGYTTSQLGSTNTEYNPDTHALIQARSTLDPSQLDYTTRRFRTEVAEHELGHALGLAHAPEYMHSVMIPRNVKSGITKNDRRTLRYLYNGE